ncbi:MAG TPA: NADH-quinone oxidoreductase subunit C [Spirochaetia bacterium]|nr:NADH-quinone oxidoreductase subunit C [Spirochaetia bacterium]
MSAADLSRIQGALAPWLTGSRLASDTRLDMETPAENLLAAVTAFRGLAWGYLSAITGLDGLGPAAGPSASEAAPGGAPAQGSASQHGTLGSIEVLYQFCQGPCLATLRVRVPRDRAEVPSISGAVPSAVLFERELSEMLGVHVTGLPGGKRQFLPDDWPPNVFPLRKDFLVESAAPVADSAPSVGSGEAPGTFIVPIGPQHPALKEPGHFEFAVDGEIITGASIRLGYVHRGIEKAAEDRSWVQGLYLVERICGICSHIHATAYALGVEALAGMTIPPRGQAIRTLLCELERIHSHLLWLGVAAHEAGFDTLFMFSWRDRETVMDLLEQLTGNRVNYAANLIGGVKYEIDAPAADAIRRGMDYLEGRARHYLKIVTTDESFLRRTRGVGTISREMSERFGTVGPTARASGVPTDLRAAAPYAAYGQFPVTPVVDQRCDQEARFVVRVRELSECFRVVREILDRLPPGDLSIPAPRKVAEGEAVSRVEAPRGELFYYLRSTGGVKPDRVKVRTPSLCNWAAVVNVVIGQKLADVPVILAGIDPCFSCNDRSLTLRRRGKTGAGGVETWSWEDLRTYGIRWYGGGRS